MGRLNTGCRIMIYAAVIIVWHVKADNGSTALPDNHQMAALVEQSPTSLSDVSCRHQEGLADSEVFKIFTCNQCFVLVVPEMILPSHNGRVFNEGIVFPNGSVLLPDVRNKLAVEMYCEIIGNKTTCDQWIGCCEAAEKCCQEQLADASVAGMGLRKLRNHCPRLWDGHICWPAADRGEMVQLSCPGSLSGTDSSAFVSKICTTDGKWRDDKNQAGYTGCNHQGGPAASGRYRVAMEKDVLMTSAYTSHVASVNGSLPTIQPTEPSTCRYWDGFMDRQSYKLITCGYCYKYLFPEGTELYPYKTFLVSRNGTIFPHGARVVPDASNEATAKKICQTLKTDTNCDQWLDCCAAADLCCESQLKDASTTVIGEKVSRGCPGTWDGYTCWSRASPGQVVQASCPGYIPHAIPSADAIKTCTSNGTWYRSLGDKEWTNYTTCLNFDEFKTNVYIKIVCNAVSLIALVPALGIFLAYRSLRQQHRIRLHIHLFGSFVLYSFVNILWEALVVYERMSEPSSDTLMASNSPRCKFIYVLTRYSRSTNFVWMFCEGLYLHRLIAKAFTPPKKLLMFYILGWGFPWIPVSAYSIIRLFHKNESCWVHHAGSYEWIFYIPNLLALLANFVFLVDILRILLTQLQSHPNEPSNYRRALKATFVLVPLFGLQMFLVIYRPPLGSRAGVIYDNVASFVVNSQGFFAALIFCLVNGEVLTNLKRTLLGYRCFAGMRQSQSKTLSTVTQASECHGRDNPKTAFCTPDQCTGNDTRYIAMKPVDDVNGYC